MTAERVFGLIDAYGDATRAAPTRYSPEDADALARIEAERVAAEAIPVAINEVFAEMARLSAALAAAERERGALREHAGNLLVELGGWFPNMWRANPSRDLYVLAQRLRDAVRSSETPGTTTEEVRDG